MEEQNQSLFQKVLDAVSNDCHKPTSDAEDSVETTSGARESVFQKVLNAVSENRQKPDAQESADK